MSTSQRTLPPLVSTRELATLAGVSRQAVHQAVQRGEIRPAHRVGRAYAFTRRTAEAFAAARTETKR
ncbi:helix-turn-helix domain-containing protein [Pseudoclavibacter albus]|uniref:helix-turn-helix domain-containing protein n=1 Tax=Pseudoclavibacter albus TaxID=272241 RepID=UPI0035CD15CE